MNRTAKQTTGLAIGLAVVWAGYASDIWPGYQERFSLLSTRDSAIGEAGKAITTRFGQHVITGWKLCEIDGNEKKFALAANLANSLAPAVANIRETRWGWRVRARYVNERYRADRCEILDQNFVAKEIAKSE